MELLFWLIIITFWIIFSLAKKKEQQSQSEKPPFEIFEEEVLETLGFPTRIPKEKHKYKKEEEIIPVQSPKEKEKPKAEAVLPPAAPEIKPEPYGPFSFDNLEEGIVFSVVLGPPKAFDFYLGSGQNIRPSSKTVKKQSR